MTEMKMETERKLCLVGRSMPDPCPFPATHRLAHLFPGEEGDLLCAYHAATAPLVGESDALGVSVELVRAYLEDARGYPSAGPIVAVLERTEADLQKREAVVDKVLQDLKAAEYTLMRG